MGSGSDRALLYDNLLAEHRTEEYPKILSRARAIGAVSLGLSMLLGGVLQNTWSWNTVYIFFAISKLIGALAVTFIPEIKLPSISLNSNKASSMHNKKTERVSTSLINFFRSKKGAYLIPLFIGYALFELSTIPLFIYGQPFFSMQGLDIPIIAGIYAAVEAMSAAMFIAAGFICSRFSLGIISFTTTIIVTFLLFILSLNIGLIASIASFLLIMSLPAIYETSYETYIHDNIESHIRASCLSVANLVNSVIIGISYTIFGGLLGIYGFSLTLIIVAASCFVGLFGVSTTLLLGEKKPLKNKKPVYDSNNVPARLNEHRHASQSGRALTTHHCQTNKCTPIYRLSIGNYPHQVSTNRQKSRAGSHYRRTHNDAWAGSFLFELRGIRCFTNSRHSAVHRSPKALSRRLRASGWRKGLANYSVSGAPRLAICSKSNSCAGLKPRRHLKTNVAEC
ncbi:MFS transporter [Pseudomonas sp. FG1]|uniref:MFS transporter n=1 Tax=Pseudomonas sp. FG1 TaxID=3048624 RepID=UPI002AB383ED|nr:MFS transporter [Pseudomonas sp. FG1]MDY7553498.1 MFS transporter [Pseudomonas sp. FG1]